MRGVSYSPELVFSDEGHMLNVFSDQVFEVVGESLKVPYGLVSVDKKLGFICHGVVFDKVRVLELHPLLVHLVEGNFVVAHSVGVQFGENACLLCVLRNQAIFLN